MRGVRQDPCKRCGLIIEHDLKPSEVYCYHCAPPPTTEWRRSPAVVCKHCIFIWGITVGIWPRLLIRWVYS
jgi:hypothetical protein